jgi:hypothetical protein
MPQNHKRSNDDTAMLACTGQHPRKPPTNAFPELR